jgi:hypothetical protein
VGKGVGGTGILVGCGVGLLVGELDPHVPVVETQTVATAGSEARLISVAVTVTVSPLAAKE